MNSTYGGFVKGYDPRKPNMHSIHRAEDDTRTLSPEMDEWKKRQLAKQIEREPSQAEILKHAASVTGNL